MQDKTPKLLLPQSSNLSVGIVVAMGLDRAIGQNGTMPWYVPEDLKHFKQQTLHSCVIMGRRTFESIGRPLPARRNIVVSKDTSLAAAHRVEVAASLEEALRIAKEDEGAIAAAQTHGIDVHTAEKITYDSCFVIGGARLFAEALEFADKVIITHLRCRFPEADVFFPELPQGFRLAKIHPQGENFASLPAALADAAGANLGANASVYFHSEAIQPEGFVQQVPQGDEVSGVQWVDAEGKLVDKMPTTPGLDYRFETYVRS